MVRIKYAKTSHWVKPCLRSTKSRIDSDQTRHIRHHALPVPMARSCLHRVRLRATPAARLAKVLRRETTSGGLYGRGWAVSENCFDAVCGGFEENGFELILNKKKTFPLLRVILKLLKKNETFIPLLETQHPAQACILVQAL